MPTRDAYAKDQHAALVGTLRAAGCVFAEDEADLLLATAGSPGELARMLERRVGGEPLEQIIGWAEFCGLRITLAPGVFVPRRRSEFLVAQAVRLARRAGTSSLTDSPPIVVDMCCGAGALGAATAAALGQVELHAADIDPVAVRCAADNIAPFGGVAVSGDLYDPLPSRLRGRVHLLLANAPYVPSEAVPMMPPEARDHEPLVALDGGPDGLDVVRAVLAGAGDWLAPDGRLLIEVSEHQASAAMGGAGGAGLAAKVRRSKRFAATVLVAGHPARPAG